MTSTAPRQPLEDQPDLKVTPHPTVVEADRGIARGGDATRLEPVPRRSLAARLTRGFLQLLLPILVVGAGLAAHQYLKATRPEA